MSFGINIPKVNIPDRIQPTNQEKIVSNNVVPELKNEHSRISRKLDEYSGKIGLNHGTQIELPSQFEFPTKIKTSLGNRLENIIEKIDKNTKVSPYHDKYGSVGKKIDITDDNKKHKLTIITSSGGMSESPLGIAGSMEKTQILFGDDKEQYGIAIDTSMTLTPAGPVPIPYILPEKKTGDDEGN